MQPNMHVFFWLMQKNQCHQPEHSCFIEERNIIVYRKDIDTKKFRVKKYIATNRQKREAEIHHKNYTN